MITAIVQYKLPPSISLADCAAHFRKIAPGFRAVPGLIRKQFIYAEDGCAGGAICGRRAATPRPSIPGRGSTASASAMAWTRRSSISRLPASSRGK